MCTTRVKHDFTSPTGLLAALLLATIGAALPLGAAGCAARATSFAWHDPLALRSCGPGGRELTAAWFLAEPEAVLDNAAYTKLAVTGLFLREVGLAPGETALVGLSLGGALAGGGLVQGVSEPVTVDAQGGLEVKPAFSVEAFAFASELSLELTVLRVDAEQALAARKALAEAGGPVWPYDERSVAAGRARFAAAIGLPRAGQQRWSTRMLLRERRKGVFGPSLVAGRNVAFFQPPPQAPASLRQNVDFKILTTKLGMRGESPIWKESDEPFRAAPYAVFTLERARRLGWKDHPAYRKLAELDAHIEATAVGTSGSLEKAQASLAEVPQAALSPNVFTAAEQELLKTLLELRRRRLAIAEAQQKSDLAEQIQQQNKLAELLESLRGGRGRPSPMLTEAEAVAFAMEATRLRQAVKAAMPR